VSAREEVGGGGKFWTDTENNEKEEDGDEGDRTQERKVRLYNY